MQAMDRLPFLLSNALDVIWKKIPFYSFLTIDCQPFLVKQLWLSFLDLEKVAVEDNKCVETTATYMKDPGNGSRKDGFSKLYCF